jgi:Na+/alanine symporter
MTFVFAVLGAKALYLTFAWLGSAIAACWLSDRAGYGEKAGLASGLLLTVAGALLWLIIYAAFPRAGSRRRQDGLLPVRRRADDPPAP